MLVRAFKPRSGHADKKFIPGFVQGQSDGDAWVSGMTALGVAAGDDWVADFDDGTVQFRPKSFSQKTLLMTEYSGDVSASETIAYQRRRKPGVGLT